MGLILDTSILIDCERKRISVDELLVLTSLRYGNPEIALSAISVVELTHGVYRARTVGDRERRQVFVDNVLRGLMVYPVTTPIAQLAGKIDGEQAAKGLSIDFEDLVIGSTALYLGYEVATLNRRHFEQIPGLVLASLAS